MGRFARGVLYFFIFIATVSLAVLMIVGFNVDFRLAGLVASLAFLGMLYWVNHIDRNQAEQRLAIKLNDLEHIIQVMSENHQVVTDQLQDISQEKLLDDQGPIKRMTMALKSQEAVIEELAHTVARVETSLKLISNRLDIVESDIEGLVAGSEADRGHQTDAKTQGAKSDTRAAKPQNKPQITPSDDKQKPILDAIDNQAFDLHIQPIVTLPQRRTIFYEILTRLTGPKNEIIMPSSFLPTVSEHRRLAELDEMIFYQSVHLLRRLVIRTKDVGIFCNISSDLLRDETRFPKIIKFIETNRALVPSIIFEFTQASFQSFSSTEFNSLNALREQGIRFSLDNLFALSPLDFSKMADLGFRYMKIPVSAMLGKLDLGKSDIHLADMAHLLNRHQIQLVVEKVERESDIVEVLDYDANFAQGYLFSRPRSVKNTNLLSDRADTVTKQFDTATSA